MKLGDAKFGDLTGLDMETGDMFEVKLDDNGDEIRVFTENDGRKIDRETNTEYDNEGNNIADVELTKIEKKEKIVDEKASNYVLSVETLLLSNNRFGFLQKPIQKLFEIDYTSLINQSFSY